MQVMVSDTGLYHGDMKQRASESMPFSRFLQAMRLEATRSAQHWYLAQVQGPRSQGVHPSTQLAFSCHARQQTPAAMRLAAADASAAVLPRHATSSYHSLLPALILLLSLCRQ